MSKYKKGDILLYKRSSGWSDAYLYIKKVYEDSYDITNYLQYSDTTTYMCHVIDNSDRISLSLKTILKQL